MKLLGRVLSVTSFVFLFGCSTHTAPQPPMETSLPNEKPPLVRHAWTVFNGPERTILGVNDKDSISRGQALFKQHCQQCHGASGIGDGPKAKAEGLKPANLTTMSRVFPNYYLVVQINNGRGDMPSWQDVLSPKEAWDLTNYIQTLKKNNPKK